MSLRKHRTDKILWRGKTHGQALRDWHRTVEESKASNPSYFKKNVPQKGYVEVTCRVCHKHEWVRPAYAKKYHTCSYACRSQDDQYLYAIERGGVRATDREPLAYKTEAGAKELLKISAAVPDSLPHLLRDEVIQEMVIANILGDLPITAIFERVDEYVRKARRNFGNYAERSLDEPVRVQGKTSSAELPLSSLVAVDTIDMVNKISPPPTPPQDLMLPKRGGQYNGQYIECVACGSFFYVTPYYYKKGRRYCSRGCWYKNRHPNKPVTKLSCEGCGQPFLAATITTRFCSQQCRQRAWHRRMTQEQRCHWCGQPSAEDYKDACDRHKQFARANTQRSKRNRRQERRDAGLCADCGKRPARFGFSNCQQCSRKNVPSQAVLVREN